MQYRTLGKTGLEVSVLGFGFMRLPCGNQILNSSQIGDLKKQVNFEETQKLYSRALELGINYFDTAYVYHAEQSEKVLGTLMKETNTRKDVVLATKMPCSKITSKDHFEKFFALQLENLQTDYIDVYLMHSLNKARWEFMKKLGALEFLEQKKKEGRIKHIGFSFHDTVDTLIDIVDEYDFEVAQIQLNYIDTHMQAGLEGFAYLAGKGLGIVIVEPLKGGTLADNAPPDIKTIWESAEIQRSPAEWGMRWIFDKKNVACALSGMNTLEQLEENAKVAAEHQIRSLSNEEQELYKKAREVLLSHSAIPCTGCKYCMPCGHGTDIPLVFSLYNQFVLFKDKDWVAKQYATAIQNNEAPLKCRSCNKCARKCPQSIDVPKNLKMAHEVLFALISSEENN